MAQVLSLMSCSKSVNLHHERLPFWNLGLPSEMRTALMHRMGSKNLVIDLQQAANKIPESLSHYNLKLSDDGLQLHYRYDVRAQKTGIVDLLSELKKASFKLRDLQTSQSSLEEIFVNLIKE